MLRYYNAAPAATPSYDAADLNSFLYVTQDKVVFENEPLRSALDSVLRWEPAVRTVFHPGLRRWRFLNLFNGITRNITINDFSGEYKVLQFELVRSIAGRYTAVRIVGPETLVQMTFDTDSGSLTEIPSGIVLETYSDGTGMHDVDAVNAWQITDPTLRRIGRLLTTPVVTATSGGSVETVRPLLEVSYDSGATWYGIPWASINFHTGIVTTGGVYPHKDTVSALIPASTQTKFSPTDVRFTVCSYAAPITVRAPTSGYSGTAYTNAGLTVEQWIYDEMLAVGYDPYGIPVTTLERTNAYQVIANLLLQQRQDIIYGGGMVLEGMQYDFVRLNSRVNIAAIDGSGNTITTGWESIGAFVTEAVYDYSEKTTTIQMSSDQLALAEFNPDFLRHRLGIKTLQLKQTLEIHPVFRTYMSKFSSHPMTEMSGVQYTIGNSYIDPTNPKAPAQAPIQGHHANFRPNPGGSQTPIVANADQLERREAEPIVVNVTL